MLGALLLRLLWIQADAATTLTWSGAPFTDEGLYTHVARNRVLFGTWRTDGWDDRLVSPLFDGLAFLVFSLFGVGYVQVRLISVAFAIVALPFFFDFLRRDLGSRWALLGAALWGLDYFWFQYSRLGLIEPGLVAWLVVAAWCWRRALDGNVAWAIACGIYAAVAYVWKSLALLFVPVPLLALLLVGITSKRRIVAGYLGGLGIVGGSYVLVWYLPHAGEIVAYNQFYASDRIPGSLFEAWQALWRNMRSREVWAQTPILTITAMLGIVRALRSRRSIPPAIALCAAWLLCGPALLIMPYSPSRYYTLLVPAIVGLAVFAVRITDNQYYPSSPRLVPTQMLVVTCLVWSGYWYIQWAGQRRTTLIDSSRALQTIVPPGQVILGVHGCGLSLANDLPCAPPVAGLANDEQPVERLNARYAIVENGNPDDFMRRFYGALLARSRPLRQLDVGPRRVTVYELAQDER